MTVLTINLSRRTVLHEVAYFVNKLPKCCEILNDQFLHIKRFEQYTCSISCFASRDSWTKQKHFWISIGGERVKKKKCSEPFAKLILIYASCFWNMRLWQLQNKPTLDWVGRGQRGNPKLSDGGDFPFSFFSRDTQLFRIYLTYKLHRVYLFT